MTTLTQVLNLTKPAILTQTIEGALQRYKPEASVKEWILVTVNERDKMSSGYVESKGGDLFPIEIHSQTDGELVVVVDLSGRVAVADVNLQTLEFSFRPFGLFGK